MSYIEPMILVKKKDGTTERVPLSSLQKQSIISTSSSVDEEESKEKKIESLPSLEVDNIQLSTETNIITKTDKTVRESVDTLQDIDQRQAGDAETGYAITPVTPHELATSTPVDRFFTDLAKAHEWDKTDHVSPLEEFDSTDIGVYSENTSLPDDRFEDARRIAEAVPFAISQDLFGRLHALIQSRIKDIRNDEQVKIYAKREVGHGGLGLREEDADILISTILSVLSIRRSVDIPQPAKTVLDTSKLSSSFAKRSQTHNILDGKSEQKGRETVSFKDIHPPEKQASALGPVGEIGSMTLVEFRRFSRDPHTAIEVLKTKMDTIREESYLEYLKAQDAWFRSPLYSMYIFYLGKGLEEKKKLQDVLNGEMTEEDIYAITTFSESIRF